MHDHSKYEVEVVTDPEGDASLLIRHYEDGCSEIILHGSSFNKEQQ
jgi:hypothetical protein